ncbi:hypothetical protein BRC91_09805 [Halobacteriales archaeon QS_4_62_28]|nr:MAG: hypothetical protein BRC91_09805 [Halobacteriales archaeon QS_4_62_28]
MKVAGVATAGALLTGASQTGAASNLEKTIIIDGSGTSGESSYEFEVAEQVEPIYNADNEDDTIDDTVVSGTVGNEISAYGYSRGILSLNVDGPGSLLFGSGLADQIPEPRKELVIRSESEISYEFTTTGEITKLLDNGANSAEQNNDTIVQNNDGTWTATGYTGNGYGDGFAFRGEVTDFSPKVGSYELSLDGNATDAYELTGTEQNRDELVIHSDSEVSYEFTTTGEITKLLDNGTDSAEQNNDTVVQNNDGTWTATGYTGNGYGDGFEFDGEVTGFNTPATDYTVLLNGQETDKWSLTGTEKPEIRDSDIGGGGSYTGQTFSESDATVVVTSRDELVAAMDSVGSGDVVFIPGDVAIQMNGTTVDIPDGVTLASDRGTDGSSGALISEPSDGNVRVLRSENNVHLSGLRLYGPHHSEFGVSYSNTWDHAGIGFQMYGSGGEVSNCEVAGFGYDALRSRGDNHIHHSVIRNNSMSGLGYGVQVFSGSNETIVEYCEFDRNRHCIAGQGSAGYTARYNICRERQVHHAFDHHGDAGQTEIHNNRFEMVPGTVDVMPSAFRARECIDGPIDIHHNWCFNPNEPDPNNPGDQEAAFANGGCDFRNMNIQDNHYGTSTPPSGVGLDL